MNNKLMNIISLSWELSKTELKLKYRGSILGFLWSLLNPFFTLLTLYIVFHMFMRLDIPNYELYLLLGIVLWTFFVKGTLSGLAAIVSKGPIVKKIYFPREILVFSTCLSEFISLIFNLVVFFAMLFLVKPELATSFIYFPFLLLKLFLLVFGLALALSALQVYYRDIQQIWEVLTQAGFWLTPIIYDISIVPQQYVTIYLLNPVTIIIVSARNLLIYQQTPDLIGFMSGYLYYILILAAGYYIFTHYEPRFAEEL
ncbi:MAG: ABC transporter permease [Candidatus Altiarchaeota archaeon]|nr:ABC transporter permease [Candidatus Altiarchaeota archaeon]